MEIGLALIPIFAEAFLDDESCLFFFLSPSSDVMNFYMNPCTILKVDSTPLLQPTP